MNKGLIILIIILVVLGVALGIYAGVADHPFWEKTPSIAVQVILPNSTAS